MMKKSIIAMAAAVALMGTSCGSTSGLSGLLGNSSSSSTSSSSSSSSSKLGSILGSIANSGTTSELLNMVIGGVKISQSQLEGTWYYSEPGCAFTSENLLAKAGGAVAAAQVKSKLQSTYSSLGISSSNTYLTFDSSNKFSGKVRGISVSGTYTYDSSTSALNLKALLFSTTAYVTRTTSGIGLMFESKKLISLLQKASKLTGNSKVEAIGSIASNYDGVRLGLEMKK